MDIPQRPPSPRSPIFIELAGTPAAGKTTMTSRLQHFFASRGVLATVAEEPAGRYPGPPQEKLTPRFNEWTLGESLSAIADHRSNRTAEIVIFDRGAFDSLFWLSWFRSSRGFDETAYAAAVTLARPFLRHISCLVLLTCNFEVARQRRPQAGRIMNAGIYPQVLANYVKPSVGDELGLGGVSHLRLDSSDLAIGAVEARIRAYLGAPQDGDRNDVLAALVRHSVLPKARDTRNGDA
jgi:deoxyadenosine/deoxycytidine kinase